MNLIHKLAGKNNTSLEIQLRWAINLGVVNSQYDPSQSQQPNETNDQYFNRIREESITYQFVAVKSVSDEVKYVAFGTPGPVINEFGRFWLVPAEVVGGRWGKHYFLFYDSMEKNFAQENLFVRIDSGCFIGMIFNDNTCDCKQQLDLAMSMASQNGSGLIIEIPEQDGRGWKEFKLANQRIIDELDINTAETAERFYQGKEFFDVRTYDEAALILKAIGLGNKVISLGTNNPKKINGFMKLGIQVNESVNILPTNLSVQAQKNFQSKSDMWGHKSN